MREQVFHDDDTHRLVAVGSVLVSVNFVPPTVKGTQRVIDAIQKLHTEHPEGVSLVLVPSAPRPVLSSAASHTIELGRGDVDGKLRCAAVWINRQGFGASVVRSLATGVLLMRRTKLPVEMVATADEAVKFVASHEPSAPEIALKRRLSELSKPRSA